MLVFLFDVAQFSLNVDQIQLVLVEHTAYTHTACQRSELLTSQS
jgi:hypothetical protein